MGLKRIMAGVVLTVVLMGISSPAYAYHADGSGKINVTENPATWCQWCKSSQGAVFDYNTMNLSPWGGSGYTLGSSGCYQFSLAYIQRKSGVQDDSFDVKAMYEMYKNNPTNAMVNNDGNGIANKLGVFTDGKLVLEGRSVTSKQDVITAFNEGYYVMLHVPGSTPAGHWVVVDEVKDGEIMLFDSAVEGDGTAQVALAHPKYNNTILGAFLFKPTGDVVAANDAPTLNDFMGGVTGGSKSSKDAKTGSEVKDLELLGMPTLVNLGAEGLAPVEPAVNFPLESSENASLTDIMETRANEKSERDVAYWLSIATSLLGIVLMMWGILQVATYVLDRANSGLTNTYRMATVGSRTIALDESYKDQSKGTKPRAVGWGGMALTAGGTFLLGAFTATGGIFWIFRTVAEVARDLIGIVSG